MGDRKQPTPCPEGSVKPPPPPEPPRRRDAVSGEQPQPPTGRYLVHASPGEIRDGELHWSGGWYFERMFDGTVKIRFHRGTDQGTAMIPREQWEAIVQHVAGLGK